MTDPIKITSLEAENVKRVRAVQLHPSENGLTIIGGNNNQGKTSLLDTIAWALGGDRFRPSMATREGSTIPPHIKVMYKIKAPNEEYDRKIGGVQFVSGEAQTDNEWLASWFSGRAGFTVETVTAEEETEPTEDKPRGKRRNDKGNADAAGAKPAAEPAAGNA